MTDSSQPEQPQRLAKIQAELVDLSAKLNILARDFQQLAAELPQQVGVPGARPAAPGTVPGAPVGAPPAPVPPPVARPSQPPYLAPQPPMAVHGQGQNLYPPPPPPRVAAPGGRAPQPPAPVPARPVRPTRPRRQVSIAEVFAVVGSGITLLGVAFVLLLPNQAVMPDLVRAGIGLGLAVAAVIVALVQHRREPSNIGSQALMATGIASAFLTVLALSSLFHGDDGAPLFPTVPGIVAGGLISLGGVAVARWWRSQWLAVLAVLGSLVLAPYLGGRDALWPMTFMLVMTLATAAFQHKLDWTGLLLARFLPTALYFLVAVSGLGTHVDVQLGLGLSLILALGGLVIATLHQRGAIRMRAVSLMAMVTMAAPLVVAMWSPDRVLAAVVAGAFGLLMVAVGLLPAFFELQLRGTAAPLGALFVVLAVVRFTDGHYLGYLFFTLAAAYFAVAAATKFTPMLFVGGALGLIGVQLWLPVIAYAFAPLPGGDIELTAQSVLGLVATLFGMRALRRRGVKGNGLVYASWLISVVFGSMAVITAGMLIAVRVGAEISQGFQTAHAIVTVGWILASVWLLRRGLLKERDSSAAVAIAIALSASAVVKLFFFDLRTLPDLVRAMAFLAVGLLLLVIGTWYHRQLERARRTSNGPTAAADGAVNEPVPGAPAPTSDVPPTAPAERAAPEPTSAPQP
ncbi:MAG: hypothetical protein CVT62_09270 [Actinobacteria bacterium HGW-Actinobacteria-2]|nr:MAG: hypothetical protein CVT62_09270 [Actinobacteria bacterium HGW-Actinobacteria-2]